MKLDPVLTKAVRLAKKKNYDGAIKTLENEASRYNGSFTYYYLLGITYLYSKIFGRSLSYLRLAYEQKMRDPNTLLGLASLYLNHGDTDKAVDLYLEVQSLDESNRLAKKALKTIRKFPGPENISAGIDSGRLPGLFPPFPRIDVSRKRLVFGFLAGLAVIFVAFGVVYKTGFFQGAVSSRVVPAEINLEKEERDAPVVTGGSYRYVLTRNQVLEDYNEGRKLFTEYRDDAAKVKLNRILESNASEPIKNRARLLISYMEVPGFDSLKDRFSYGEVTKDPFIYRDCHVIWRGMVTNLDIGQSHTAFDFLVGYDTRRTMEGIVQVDFDFAIPVNPERVVEILGRVIPVSSEREFAIRIQGVALNQAGLLGN
jgi:tetratricopeptide (TPR) repeat protein